MDPDEYQQMLNLDKITTQAYEFGREIMQYVCDMESMAHTLDKDFRKINREGLMSLHEVSRQSIDRVEFMRNQLEEKQRREREEIEREHIERLRAIKANSKRAREESKRARVLKTSSPFSGVHIKHRAPVPLGSSESVLKIPRPVWGIIIDFLGPVERAKLERTCRQLYVLCNPICKYCLPDHGSEVCLSFWRQIALDLNFEGKYGNENCFYMKKWSLQTLAQAAFLTNLDAIRRKCCEFSHHPLFKKDEDFYQCFYCRKAFRKSAICGGLCNLHQMPCCSVISKTNTCKDHACGLCYDEESVRKHLVLQEVTKDCSKVLINKNGRKNQHELIFKENLIN